MQSQLGAIQRHFSFLKGSGISADEMNCIALDTTAFNQTEFEMIQNQRNGILKIDAFLKKLIRKGNHQCTLFLEGLRRTGHAEIVHVITETENSDANSDANTTGRIYQCLTKAFIKQHREYICKNLQVISTLDLLFERSIISINEHDLVQNKETKSSKREELMKILLNRPDTTWISNFITVMRLTGHDAMFQQLLQISTTGQVSGDQQSSTISLGGTRPMTPNNFVACLFGDNDNHDHLNIQDVRNTTAIQEALDAGVIEIWEGCIYFHLTSLSPVVILSILNGEDDRKLKIFLEKFLQENEKLLHHIRGQNIFHFSLEELPIHALLDSSYGKKPRNQKAINHRDYCLDCYRSTLRALCNYEIVLDEIEDDIIDDTLKRIEESRSDDGYVSKRCFSGNKTRSEKAFNFMQYVLYNESVLEEFKKVFSYRSQVKLKPYKCQPCATGFSTAVMPRKRIFHFKIDIDNYGKVNITDIKSELRLPSLTSRLLMGSTGKRKMFRAMSMIDMPALKDVEEYRIAVMGNAQSRTEFYRSTKLLYGETYKFYELPSFCKEISNEKDKKIIADCIARTSPGPHAFVLFTESFSHTDLMSTMDPYIKYFGPNIVQFLVVVFTIKRNDTNYPVEMVEDIVESTLPLLKQCQYRYLVFNTSSEQKNKFVQVKRLTRLIKQIRLQKVNEYYSSEIFEKSEKEVQKTTDKIRNEIESQIRRLRDKIVSLRKENPRDKATDKLLSQKSFIDMVCSVDY
ncbi:uncharacterized protein LOC127699830 isoform X1 [Mytilus californianus]|uniref:uncharacterized protein LOC127699830 isoform X1 n=2 Tax=Mytilus californianus TaxID=6549 RepID=UPI002248215A|nr:uncharacterized protein LOC127699830 isoform X1 [Mytilus californianus]XP_052059165.1 uncharacterized protein LOC127699830 isoform X1 [Mytilus californianus]XP_052059166.1 uncharacterized protein LOC127699830 isoform X1 [Mytilus californianus]